MIYRLLRGEETILSLCLTAMYEKMIWRLFRSAQGNKLSTCIVARADVVRQANVNNPLHKCMGPHSGLDGKAMKN
jgi:hypothetical protein